MAVTPTGSPPQAGVGHSRTAPRLSVVDGDHVPAGVDVRESVSTKAVVKAAKVASYPSRTFRSSPAAPLFLSGASAAKNLVAAAGVAQLGALTGLTTIPAGQSTIPGRVTHVPAACEGTGWDGPRVQVLYVAEKGSSRYWELKESLESYVADVDDVFALSSRKTDSGRRVRWSQDSSCGVIVAPVTVPVGMLGSAASPGAAFNSMKSALQTAGYRASSTKYLVFADKPALCGIADSYVDSKKELNDNDGATTMYARVDPQCWRTDTTGKNTPAHELMHMLGAVQNDAPNALLSHCTDESDVMCYAQGGQVMRQVCPLDQESLFDCENNDYFNAGANLDPVSYLGSHWNTADSHYLTSAPVLPVSPVVTGPEQVPSGGSAVFTAAHPSITTFQWTVQSAAGCTATPLAGRSTTVSCPAGAVAGPVKVVATGTASDGQLAEGGKQSSVVDAPPLPLVTMTGPSTLTDVAAEYTVSPSTVSSNPLAAAVWTSSNAACAITNAATLTATVTCTGWNGELTLTATVTDVYGQVVTQTMPVTVTSVPPPPEVTIEGPSTLTDVAGAYTVSPLDAPSNPLASAAWTSSTTACVITNPATFAVSVTCTNWDGELTLTATVTDAYGQVVTETMPVTVASVVVVPFTVTASGPSTMRPGRTGVVKLASSSLPVASYSWTSSYPSCLVGVTTGSSVRVKCPARVSGTVTFTLTAKAADGQTATAVVTVKLKRHHAGHSHGHSPCRDSDSAHGR